MLLEMGRVPIKGAAEERLLSDAVDALMSDAGLQ
jgi:hypothetical protein